MSCSEARLNANRANAQKSTGPKTAEGKERSRRNGLKHGLSGSGVVAPELDQVEVEARSLDLMTDLKPKTNAGLLLVIRMATCSVRMDRATTHDFATTAHRVRHAALDFDEARRIEAARLFDVLHEDPRNNLRRLRMTPEGVELLLDEWTDLREDLTADPLKPRWAAKQLEQAALLTGTRTEHCRTCRIGALTRGMWGDFARLSEQEGGTLSEEARQEWAKAKLLERIDAEIAGLEAHYETLDFDLIAADRLEAGERALFDASKAATLARRYESEAQRGFFKALKELRIIEAEAAARPLAGPVPPPPFETGYPVGSDRDRAPSSPRTPSRDQILEELDQHAPIRRPDGTLLTVGRAPQTAG